MAEPRARSGWRILIVALYAILTLAALGRSLYQVISSWPEVPLAYWLSALAAVVYIFATVALLLGENPSSPWRRVAWLAISFELAGVLIVGTLSLVAPQLLGQEHAELAGPGATVWTLYGMGYVLIPLILPIVGLFWLSRTSGSAPKGSA